MAGQLGFGGTIVTAGPESIIIGDVKKVSIPGVSCDVIDITTLASANKVADKMAGKNETSEIEVTAIYSNATNKIPSITDVGGPAVSWVISVDDFDTTQSKFTFVGYISSLSIGELGQDDKVEMTYTIAISGKPTFTLGS